MTPLPPQTPPASALAAGYLAPAARPTDGPSKRSRRPVAAIFRVGVRTVAGWARDGKLDAVHTPGGHRRFRAEDVTALVRDRARPRQSSVTREITDRMVQEMDQRRDWTADD